MSDRPRSPLLTAADVARRRTPWWLTLIVFFVVFLVGALVSVVTFVIPDDAGPLLEALLFAIPALVIAYGVRMLIVAGWLRWYERRPFRSVGFPGRGMGQALRGFVFGLLAVLVIVGVMALAGAVTLRDARPGFTGLAALGGVLIVLVGWIVQGTAEEVMYRGFLLQLLGRYSVVMAVVVSSVLFLLGHQSAFGNAIAMLNLFLSGVFFCVYALREGGLWGPSGFHVAWNFAQGTLLGFLVSGKEVPGGSLIALQTQGNDLVAGGGFGPEGTVICTIVLLVLIAGLSRWAVRSDSHEATASAD